VCRSLLALTDFIGAGGLAANPNTTCNKNEENLHIPYLQFVDIY
jgi:hypothetical protein